MKDIVLLTAFLCVVSTANCARRNWQESGYDEGNHGDGSDIESYREGYGDEQAWDGGDNHESLSDRPVKTVIKHVVKNIAVPHHVPKPVPIAVPKYIQYLKPFPVAKPVAVPQVIPVLKHIQKPIPVFRAVPVAKTVPVPKFIALPVPVKVPRPVLIHVPKFIPVAKKYPVPVTVHVPKPYIIPIYKSVPVPIPHKVPKIVNVIKEVPTYIKKPVPVYVDAHGSQYDMGGGQNYGVDDYGGYNNEYFEGGQDSEEEYPNYETGYNNNNHGGYGRDKGYGDIQNYASAGTNFGGGHGYNAGSSHSESSSTYGGNFNSGNVGNIGTTGMYHNGYETGHVGTYGDSNMNYDTGSFPMAYKDTGGQIFNGGFKFSSGSEAFNEGYKSNEGGSNLYAGNFAGGQNTGVRYKQVYNNGGGRNTGVGYGENYNSDIRGITKQEKPFYQGGDTGYGGYILDSKTYSSSQDINDNPPIENGKQQSSYKHSPLSGQSDKQMKNIYNQQYPDQPKPPSSNDGRYYRKPNPETNAYGYYNYNSSLDSKQINRPSIELNILLEQSNKQGSNGPRGSVSNQGGNAYGPFANNNHNLNSYYQDYSGKNDKLQSNQQKSNSYSGFTPYNYETDVNQKGYGDEHNNDGPYSYSGHNFRQNATDSSNSGNGVSNLTGRGTSSMYYNNNYHGLNQFKNAPYAPSQNENTIPGSLYNSPKNTYLPQDNIGSLPYSYSNDQSSKIYSDISPPYNDIKPAIPYNSQSYNNDQGRTYYPSGGYISSGYSSYTSAYHGNPDANDSASPYSSYYKSQKSTSEDNQRSSGQNYPNDAEIIYGKNYAYKGKSQPTTYSANSNQGTSNSETSNYKQAYDTGDGFKPAYYLNEPPKQPPQVQTITYTTTTTTSKASKSGAPYGIPPYSSSPGGPKLPSSYDNPEAYSSEKTSVLVQNDSPTCCHSASSLKSEATDPTSHSQGNLKTETPASYAPSKPVQPNFSVSVEEGPITSISVSYSHRTAIVTEGKGDPSDAAKSSYDGHRNVGEQEVKYDGWKEVQTNDSKT